MKKIIILTTFLLSFLFSFSQDVFFGKAYLLYNAESDGNELVWNEYPTKCDILVQIEDQILTIYTQKIQKYKIVSLKENEVTVTKYLAVNSDGVYCFLYIGQYGESNDIGITVEFNDLGWTYVVTEDD